MEAIAIRLEAIAIWVEDIAIRLEAIASRLEAIAAVCINGVHASGIYIPALSQSSGESSTKRPTCRQPACQAASKDLLLIS